MGLLEVMGCFSLMVKSVAGALFVAKRVVCASLQRCVVCGVVLCDGLCWCVVVVCGGCFGVVVSVAGCVVLLHVCC